MYSAKSVTLRMEPRGTPALIGSSCDVWQFRITEGSVLLRNDETRVKTFTWNFIRFEFVKKTSKPKQVKSLGYIKCYNSNSPRPIESPSNSIRYNCQKICSWMTTRETILEVRKEIIFLEVINKPIIKFSLKAKPTFIVPHLILLRLKVGICC